MRYLIIGAMVLSFMGCGSSSTKKDDNQSTTQMSNIVKPNSPSPQNSEKKPPSIPDI